MQKRFNYTGRRRIKRNDLHFTIAEDENGRKTFYADINLTKYDLPPSATVCVEAYDRNALMRFPFGTVEKPKSEGSTTLTDFTGTDTYYFRVKVIDEQHRSRLFAVADSVSPVRRDDDNYASKSLLRVTTKKLGPAPWKLEYPVADHPLLAINSCIDTGMTLARSNRFFQALVLPAIFEQVLRHILLEDNYKPSAEPEVEDMWKEGWLEFAGCLPENSLLPTDQEISRERREEWIEDARDGFCIEIGAINAVRRELKELE